jgi:hypothetical protein
MLVLLHFHLLLNKMMEHKNVSGLQVCLFLLPLLLFYFYNLGVKSNEIILSQLMVHSVILIVQIVIVLSTTLYFFEVRINFVFIIK